MKKSALCGIALSLMAMTSSAAVVSIDFNDLSAGENVTTQYQALGLTFSLIPSPTEPGSPLPPPSGPTTWSLGPVDQYGVNGMSIIVGPTTNGPFYDVQVDFALPVDYFAITALDAETLPLRLTAFSGATALPLALTSTYLGNIGQLPYVSGPTYLLEIGAVGGPVFFDRIVFGGTEQFDNIQFSTASAVPVPAAVWLFVSGLSALAGFRRMQKSASQSPIGFS